MSKKVLLLLMPVLALCSCAPKARCLCIHKQEYSTYKEMVDIEIEYQKVHTEKEKTLFQLGFDDSKSEKFFIAGIDYCTLYAEDKLHGKEDHCPHLLYRELYSETSFDEEQIVTIIYKSKCDYDIETLKWINSNGGNCYRYEGKYKDSEQYILTDKDDNHVLGLKLSVTDDELKAATFAKVIDTIKAL